VERRLFLKHGLRDYLKELVSSFNLNSYMEEEKEEPPQDYFASFSSCYPLLSEAPYEMLVEAAKQKGISVENKTKLELAKEIFGESR
jgi:hypothetical protein